jgi:hypothetical protein
MKRYKGLNQNRFPIILLNNKFMNDEIQKHLEILNHVFPDLNPIIENREQDENGLYIGIYHHFPPNEQTRYLNWRIEGRVLGILRAISNINIDGRRNLIGLEGLWTNEPQEITNCEDMLRSVYGGSLSWLFESNMRYNWFCGIDRRKQIFLEENSFEDDIDLFQRGQENYVRVQAEYDQMNEELEGETGWCDQTRTFENGLNERLEILIQIGWYLIILGGSNHALRINMTRIFLTTDQRERASRAHERFNTNC